MFYNCTNLTSFNSNLSSLTDGIDMFYGCSLDYQSLNNILNSLPNLPGTIHITVADSVKSDLENTGNWVGITIPAYNSGNYYTFTHNGWTVQLTSRTGFTTSETLEIITDNDVSEANGNLNDTENWNTTIGRNSGITQVINEIAYN